MITNIGVRTLVILDSSGRAANQVLFRGVGTFLGNLMNSKQKKNSTQARLYRTLEEVVGCKWSVSVLMAVAAGVNRPGALERHIEGISTKMLSERLRKLSSYGLLDKHTYAEVPPRTEYALTDAGQRLLAIIAQIHALDASLQQQA